ncbi:hypothetical protein BDK62_12113 [Halomonas alkaliantarctica]|nr:hypothetical protein BDK62_12113 [Halomonas alkaliantarctica]
MTPPGLVPGGVVYTDAIGVRATFRYTRQLYFRLLAGVIVLFRGAS